MFSIDNRHEPLRRWAGFLAVLVVALPLVALAWASAPSFAAPLLAVVVLVCVAWMIRPIVALCATVLTALIGDIFSLPWYPVTKNLSSIESMMFVSTGAGISPLEMSLAAGLLALIGRYLWLGRSTIRVGALAPPLALFTLFAFVSFVYGRSTGGDLKVALFQLRPFAYLPIVYLLVTSNCRTAKQYVALYVSILVGIVVHSLLSLNAYLSTAPANRPTKELVVEHGAALRMNLLLISAIAACLFRGTSARVRAALLCGSVPVLWVYFLAQRRAAIVALVIALLVLTMALFVRQRRTFWKIVPAATIVLVGYVGAFWNSEASAAFPAQAVKSVVSPEAVSDRNQSSDLYRIAETFDLRYTIHSSPLRGIGLGQPFLQPIQLPDLEGFEFRLYIPHNSILWIWVAMGAGGFVTMIYLFAAGSREAARDLRTAPAGVSLLIACVPLYIPMFAIFAFVEISWDARNLLMLGIALAWCDSGVRRRRTAGAEVAPKAPVEAEPVVAVLVGARQDH